MNSSDLPTNQIDIDKLKDDLKSFCEKYDITKFEADDIVELLEDGETVDWIVDQIRTENEEIDSESLSVLLSDIRAFVAPPEEEEVDEAVEQEPGVEQEIPPQMPDLSQLDLSQLGDLLPPGMELPPGMDMKQVEKMMQSPQGEFLTDFSLFCQEKGLEDLQGTMSDSAEIQQLNEEWMSTPRAAFDGKTPAEMLEQNPSLMPQKVETYRREQPRVGRNDPCPCGSGKKYKKCCGRSK